jgi:hypothetical protein
VAGDDSLLGTESIKQTDHVADQVKQRVLIDFRRAVGLAVAAHIGSYRVKPGRRQGRELMTPGIPALGETVAQHDERSLALLRQMHMDAVCFDGSMPDFT